jgi:hypothetical protein
MGHVTRVTYDQELQQRLPHRVEHVTVQRSEEQQSSFLPMAVWLIINSFLVEKRTWLSRLWFADRVNVGAHEYRAGVFSSFYATLTMVYKP